MNQSWKTSGIFCGVWGLCLTALFPYFYPNEKLSWSLIASEVEKSIAPIAILSLVMSGFFVRHATSLGRAAALGVFVFCLGIILGFTLTTARAYFFASEPHYVWFIIVPRLFTFLPSSIIGGGLAGCLHYLICKPKVAS